MDLCLLSLIHISLPTPTYFSLNSATFQYLANISENITKSGLLSSAPILARGPWERSLPSVFLAFWWPPETLAAVSVFLSFPKELSWSVLLRLPEQSCHTTFVATTAPRLRHACPEEAERTLVTNNCLGVSLSQRHQQAQQPRCFPSPSAPLRARYTYPRTRPPASCRAFQNISLLHLFCLFVLTTVTVTFHKMNNGKTSTQDSEVLESNRGSHFSSVLWSWLWWLSTYKDKL